MTDKSVGFREIETEEWMERKKPHKKEKPYKREEAVRIAPAGRVL
ncbi:MAG: hypothetical protein Q4C66_07460 [Lachnospiraceae bacterium]|nr:hypothetical protein [Lachnospiraceae bacterium]